MITNVLPPFYGLQFRCITCIHTEKYRVHEYVVYQKSKYEWSKHCAKSLTWCTLREFTRFIYVRVHSQWLCHDDSTIVLVIYIIIIPAACTAKLHSTWWISPASHHGNKSQSASRRLLVVQRCRLNTTARRAFSVVGPSVWICQTTCEILVLAETDSVNTWKR